LDAITITLVSIVVCVIFASIFFNAKEKNLEGKTGLIIVGGFLLSGLVGFISMFYW
jgi:hypothetical protein